MKADPIQQQMVQPLPRALPQHFERLYASELPVVYGFLARLGARTADLEDLTHDVFITALRRWPTFDTARPVRPWMLGIAFRVHSDFRRRAHVAREAGPPPEDLPDPHDAAEARLRQREQTELVAEALESLDEVRRATFVMYELEGIPVAEISEAMGVPAPTTYSRLRTAREAFAAAVRRIQLRRGEP
jgi:RNA polymerase sigma-70 factor (ECF subfamily)